jgi:hypothetical protein
MRLLKEQMSGEKQGTNTDFQHFCDLKTFLPLADSFQQPNNHTLVVSILRAEDA